MLIVILAFLASTLLGIDVFTVIEETEDYLIVEFNLPKFEMEEINNSEFKINCMESMQTSEEGFPKLPFFSEIVGIPVDGEIEIQVISKKQKTKTGITISDAEGILNPDGFPKRAVKTENSFDVFPIEIIKKGHKAFIGDRKFYGFNVFPFQYNQKTNELIVTSNLQFRINIYGNKKTNRAYLTSNNFIDDIGESFFLNNESSQRWRKEREPAQFYPPRSGDQVNEIQIVVDEEGIYKVDYQLLLETLNDPDYPIEFEMEYDLDDIDPRFLELRDEFGPVPINFVGQNDGSFDQGDYFEFFGKRHFGDDGYYDDYTYENVYTLKLTTNYGSRMAVENGGLGNINPNQYTVPQSFKQTVHFEQQNTSDFLGAKWDHESHSFYREDFWFWQKINAPTLEIIPFELQYPHASTIRQFDAEVCLYGSTFNPYNYTEINHFAQIFINNSFIDQKEWFGQNEQILSSDSLALPLPNQRLTHGTNNLYVSIPGLLGIDNEQVLLDYFEISYWREYKTDEDFIKFQKPQHKPLGLFQFELENFSSDSVFVYKIGASILENLQIESIFATGGPPYTVSFQDSLFSENTEYYAVTNQQKKTPKFIRPNIPSNLKDSANLAEYIIITLQKFAENENLQSYVQLWESQGINTKIVYVEDIFDEFNHGIRSVDSMKEFLSYAYNNWSTPQVSHVLLLGDGLTDERDDSSNRDYNLIPFRHIWAQKRGAIASDNWLGCIVGNDLVPDISIGRIGIWNEYQIEDIVNKSIHYVTTPNYDDMWHSRIIFAAGGNPSEGSFFAEQSERIIDRKIPQDYYIKRVYCNTDGIPEGYGGNTTSLISTINDGSLYVQFMGHGGGYVWADYNLLNKADVTTFNNENFPFVASLSCYGSAFNLPQSSSIGEELILSPNKGAIAHVGFTGYGYKDADENFGLELNDGIFVKKLDTIGDIISYTKAKFYASYGNGTVGTALINGCALIGDPMIRLILPQEKKDITLDQYNATESDTISMTSYVGTEIVNGKFIVFDENDIQLPLNEYYPFTLPAINDSLSTSDFIVPDNSDPNYIRYIKVFGYGNSREITGITNFTVGQTAIVNMITIPENPGSADSVYITADFFDEDGINNIMCDVMPDTIDTEMIQIENSKYILEDPIRPFDPGDVIRFHFIIVNTIGDTTITDQFSYTVEGPDIGFQHIELTEYDSEPAIKLLIQNTGSTISGSTSINLYEVPDTTAIATINLEPLNEFESRWIFINIPLLNSNLRFRAIANENQQDFSEINYNNNIIYSEYYDINMFEVGNASTPISATSLDGNLECTFNPEIVSSPSIFYINNLGTKDPINQPGIRKILQIQPNHIADSTYSPAYEIGTLNPSVLADSVGHFFNDETIMLKFKYNEIDSLTQAMADEDNFNVYRWEEDFQKWICCGGKDASGIIEENNEVLYEANRVGIYTIFQNTIHQR